MAAWDRSLFATTPDELELDEAIRAVERVVLSPIIKDSTRVSLCMALDALRDDQR